MKRGKRPMGIALGVALAAAIVGGLCLILQKPKK